MQDERRALGFSDGVRAFFGGLGFVAGRPANWGLALVPAACAALLFAGATGFALWAGADLAARWVDPSHAFGTWAVRILVGVVGVALGLLLALSLAQPLSGFALESLARRQELALGGRVLPDQPFFPGLWRSVRVTLTGLALSLPPLALLAAIGFFFPPAVVVTLPLKLVVVGLVAAYDLLDYPLGLRGIRVRDRLAFLRLHFGAVLGFGAAAGLLMAIPGMILLLLPVGAAGAARLVHRAEAIAHPVG